MRGVIGIVGLGAMLAMKGPQIDVHDVLKSGDGRGPGKRRYIAGPHPIIHAEPKREDYPSRQAWRADYRRWKGQR